MKSRNGPFRAIVGTTSILTRGRTDEVRARAFSRIAHVALRASRWCAMAAGSRIPNLLPRRPRFAPAPAAHASSLGYFGRLRAPRPEQDLRETIRDAKARGEPLTADSPARERGLDNMSGLTYLTCDAAFPSDARNRRPMSRVANPGSEPNLANHVSIGSGRRRDS